MKYSTALAATCLLAPLQFVWAESSDLAPSLRSTDSEQGRYADVTDVLITGDSAIQADAIDSLIQDALLKHQIPGAALAIAREGRLAYARGFGYADVESRTPVQPTSLFRIASVSKPITAVGVLKLCEQGSLQLDDRVLSILGLNDYEPLVTEDGNFDPRHEEITIRQLLQHRAGWDRGKSFDPMFASVRIAAAAGAAPPASQEATIRYMLGRPLDYPPGERYCYSNFGYCLLGRLIEKASGRSYEEFIKQEVLRPLGATGMHVGRTLRHLKRDGEVSYYDPGAGPSIFDGAVETQVAEPYGVWNLEAMDAHGGWIASAVDLVKFASRYYRPNAPSLLSKESYDALIARPPGLAGHNQQGRPKPVYYGLGWQIHTDDAEQGVLQMHIGSLPGTSSLLVRRADGICYALVFNARTSPHTNNVCDEMVRPLQEAIEGISVWPAADLFERFD